MTQRAQRRHKKGTKNNHSKNESIGLVNNNKDTLIIPPRGKRTKPIIISCNFLKKQSKKEEREQNEALLKLFSSLIYGFSPPQFLQPGVDVRHTSLLYFLKSMGLKRRGTRHNLTVHIPDDFPIGAIASIPTE